MIEHKHQCPYCGSFNIFNQWCMGCGSDLPGYRKRSLLTVLKDIITEALKDAVNYEPGAPPGGP